MRVFVRMRRHLFTLYQIDILFLPYSNFDPERHQKSLNVKVYGFYCHSKYFFCGI